MIGSEFQRDKDCGKKGKGAQKEKWKGEENFCELLRHIIRYLSVKSM